MYTIPYISGPVFSRRLKSESEKCSRTPAPCPSLVVMLLFQVAADMRGYVAPFDVSALVLMCLFVAITFLWNENYGDRDSTFTTSFSSAVTAIKDSELR